MASIKGVIESTGLDLSGISFGVSNFFLGFSMFVIALIAVGSLVYFISRSRQFNKYIHIFTEINGATAPFGEDKAREIVLPNTSTRAFYLKKMKMYLPRPTLQTGKNHYWYFVRKDGEWINVEASNLNKDLKALKIHYDHTDMRMANASLKKLVEKNYKKLNWIKEYAPYIAIGIMILMLGIVAFLVLNKGDDLIGNMGSLVEAQKLTAEKITEALSGIDNICSNSGVRSA